MRDIYNGPSNERNSEGVEQRPDNGETTNILSKKRLLLEKLLLGENGFDSSTTTDSSMDSLATTISMDISTSTTAMDSMDSSKTASSIDWTDEESVGDTSIDEVPVWYLTDYIPWITNISNNLAVGSCDRDYFAKSFTEHLLEIDRVPMEDFENQAG